MDYDPKSEKANRYEKKNYCPHFDFTILNPHRNEVNNNSFRTSFDQKATIIILFVPDLTSGTEKKNYECVR